MWEFVIKTVAVQSKFSFSFLAVNISNRNTKVTAVVYVDLIQGVYNSVLSLELSILKVVKISKCNR